MEAMNLFKGKRVDNGEWVIGNLIFSEDALDGWEAIIIPTTNSNMYASDKDDTNKGDIHFENWYRVDKDTVCRCTGMRDMNDELVWENDIVKFEDYGEEQGPEYKEGYEYENNARVEFAEGRWSLTDFAEDNSAVMDAMNDHSEFMGLWNNSEVIGNIFDNPELL